MVLTPPTGNNGRVYTSLLQNGSFNPGAHNISFDVYVTAFDAPGEQNAWVKIDGPSLADLTQGVQFGQHFQGTTLVPGYTAQLFGGMSKGLPLANPTQAGLLMTGQVVQSWGNWQGTEMSLEFLLTASSTSPLTKPKIVFNWQVGQPLSAAVAASLQGAFPGVAVNAAVNPAIITTHAEAGFYSSLLSFSRMVRSVSLAAVNTPGYRGVAITMQGGAFIVTDGTVAPTEQPKQILATDLVGQSVWVGPFTMQVKTVLRGDLTVGQIIQLPYNFGQPGTAQSTAASQSGYRQTSTFSGLWQVLGLRHVGNFRLPAGDGWVTIIDAAVQP